MLSLLIEIDDPVERLLYGESDEWLRLHQPQHYLPERHFHDRYWPGAQGDPDDPDIEPWYEVGDPPPGATLYGEHDREWAEQSGWGAEQTPEAKEQYEEFQSRRDDIIQRYYDGDLSAEEYQEALQQETQQFLSANQNTAPAGPATAAAQSPTAAAASPPLPFSPPRPRLSPPAAMRPSSNIRTTLNQATPMGCRRLLNPKRPRTFTLASKRKTAPLQPSAWPSTSARINCHQSKPNWPQAPRWPTTAPSRKEASLPKSWKPCASRRPRAASTTP